MGLWACGCPPIWEPLMDFRLLRMERGEIENATAFFNENHHETAARLKSTREDLHFIENAYQHYSATLKIINQTSSSATRELAWCITPMM